MVELSAVIVEMPGLQDPQTSILLTSGCEVIFKMLCTVVRLQILLNGRHGLLNAFTTLPLRYPGLFWNMLFIGFNLWWTTAGSIWNLTAAYLVIIKHRIIQCFLRGF